MSHDFIFTSKICPSENISLCSTCERTPHVNKFLNLGSQRSGKPEAIELRSGSNKKINLYSDNTDSKPKGA